MKKKKDYFHFYIGSDVQWTRSDGKIITSKLTLSDAEWLRLRDDSKLILRPLSSMTEEEEKHMISTQDIGETFRWMLSKGFDLFDLIDSGLALDATKIEKV